MVKLISLVYVDLKFVNWFIDNFYVTDEDFFLSSKKERQDCIKYEIILVLRL